jgi:mono/diheme cytochrome c family protein
MFAVFGVVVAGVLAVASFSGRGTGGGRADANNVQQVALGKEVYAAQCASCHGVNLEGQLNWKDGPINGPMPAPPHDATGHTWHHADALLFDIVKRGGQASSRPTYQNAMPAFGSTLSDEEIWAVLAYIKSIWPADIQVAQEQVNQQAQ